MFAVLSFILASLQAPASANEFACSYKAFCEKLQPGLQPALFISHDGHSIPNYRSYQLYKVVNSCYQVRRRQEFLGQNYRADLLKLTRAHREAYEAIGSPLREKLRTAFERTVQAYEVNECAPADTYRKIYATLATQVRQESPSAQPQPQPTRQIEAWILAKERLRSETCRIQRLELDFKLGNDAAFPPDLIRRFPRQLDWELDPYLELDPDESKRAAARIQTHFDESIEDTLAKLEAFRTPANGPMLDSLKRRISSLGLQVLRMDDEACSEGVNFYLDVKKETQEHKVFICPQVGGYPEFSLRMVLAHEIVHRIGPCTLIHDAERIRWKDNPFKSVLGCLTRPESVGARLLEPIRVSMSLEEERRAVCNYPGLKISPQIEEAFADWLAIEVLAPRIERLALTGNPSAAREAASEILGAAAYNGCGEIPRSVTTQLKSQLSALGCGEFDFNRLERIVTQVKERPTTRQASGDSHPLDQDRIERIMLAKPAIAAALGCVPEKVAQACNL